MGDLILYLGITVVGYFIGSRLQDKKDRISWTGKVQTAALMILVLLMGMRMGSNEEVTGNISTIGVTAFVMTLVIMTMSVIAIILTRKVLHIDRYGRLISKENVSSRLSGDQSAANGAASAEGAEMSEEGHEEGAGGSKMTLIIVASVIAGMAVGFFVIRSVFEGKMDQFDHLAGLGIKIGLCLLLVFVGMDLGLEGTVVENFKKVGVRILAFPAAAVIGTLAGAVICSLFVSLSLRECLAIGAGFGWYTLAPGIIMENGYVTASAVSFLHNVMRELFSIIFIPVVAKKIGYVETTAMPGAAAMDVCLPIVEKSTRSDIAVYSFVSGVVLSILVPILVPLIVG